MDTHTSSVVEPMRKLCSLAQLLVRAVKLWPDSGVQYCTRGTESRSYFQRYSELLDVALRILTGLRAEMPCAGSRVVLLMERVDEFLPAFWACLLGGFVPCPLVPLRDDAERWAAQLTHIDRLLVSPLLITTERLRSELPHIPGLAVVSLECLRRNDPTERIHEADPADLALLMLTSGSTGNSKAVMLTHSNLLASMAAKAKMLKISDNDTTLNWISFDHVAALEWHLLPLYAGAKQLHVEPSTILRDPPELLWLISRNRVTMTFMPNFLFPQLILGVENLPDDALDLACLRKIISGGEAIVCATARSFLARFGSCGLGRSVLWPAFGMTETCAGSVFSSSFSDVDAGQEFASLGTPIDGLTDTNSRR